jgi:hypothetical protein
MSARIGLCVSVLIRGGAAAIAQQPPPDVAAAVNPEISGMEKRRNTVFPQG